MEQNQTISVIVPVYNAELYLNQCVQSIVDQSYQKLEIILVDDGSSDNSGFLCDTWAKRDSRITVIHKKNGGSAQARNVGLEYASGQYIGFVDSDDYLHPDMYQTLLYSLNHTHSDIAECGYHMVSTDRSPVRNAVIEKPVILKTEAAMKAHIEDKICRQLVWNKLYEKKVIGQTRFIEGKFIDDEFFTYRVIGNAAQVAVLRGQLYYYRQQQNSAMHQSYSLKRLDALDAKLMRANYIKVCFPSLSSIAQSNLQFSCIYAMQMSMRHLNGDALQEAQRRVLTVWNAVHGSAKDAALSPKEKVWLLLASLSLPKTCWLRNKLNIGF